MNCNILLISFLIISLTACAPTLPDNQTIHVVAVESFLADLTQQVAGDRLQIETLIPAGVDPHGFELTPADLVKLTSADMIVQNGQGLESWLDETLDQANGVAIRLSVSDGLQPRTADTGDPDPHFWLDPTLTRQYVQNISAGLSRMDPAGEQVYTSNAQSLLERLDELDGWIASEVAQIPADRRLLITNHETFGYFADRYGFTVIGAIIPSITTGSTPTAQEIAGLIDQIRLTNAPAIFLEIEANPQIAEQIARETGVKVVEDLYTHTLSDADGPAADYFSMMKWNTTQIINGLQ